MNSDTDTKNVEKFRKIRERLEISHAEFASLLGVHIQTVQRYSAGSRKISKTILLLADTIQEKYKWEASMSTEEFNDRIRPLGETNEEIAERIGITADAVRLYKSGRWGVSKPLAARIRELTR